MGQRASPHSTSSHWQEYNTLLENQSVKDRHGPGLLASGIFLKDILNLSHFPPEYVPGRVSRQGKPFSIHLASSVIKKGSQFILETILT